jgi:hypothetical protein
MRLAELKQTFAVCQLPAGEKVPEWALSSRGFLSITRTEEELSVVCEERLVPEMVKAERSWSAFRVQGPLDFALTGILAQLAQPLAEAKIPIFAVSTFDTDYVLVKTEFAEKAKNVLTISGHQIDSI